MSLMWEDARQMKFLLTGSTYDEKQTEGADGLWPL